MKTNKYLNFIAGVALALGMTGCASDYLDLEPEATIPFEDVLTNTDGATLAVHGICNSMYMQYSALYDFNWFNGEPWLSMFYGDVMGQDYISLFWFRSYPTFVNWTMMDQQGFGATVAWSYCYNLISQANNLITYTAKKTDDEGNVIMFSKNNAVPDIEGEYAFRYAQALTFRAHAYTRLMQIYAPRWEEREQNGKAVGTVPLRLEFVSPEGNLDCPLSTMEEVMQQIYDDLDQALLLYKSSNFRRQYEWEPDMNIAQGIYARAALVRNDYKTAQKMAHDARQGYPIMSIEDYMAGFAKPTSEWMWTNSGESQGVYFASFGATYACNGAYPCLWGSIGAGAIDNDLIEAAGEDDMRGDIFFSPRNFSSSDIKKRFWQSSSCNAQTMNINKKSGGLHNEFVRFCRLMYENVELNGWYPPYTYQGYPLGNDFTTCTAQFGAQFKFWGTDGYSASFFPFMRASEMLLIEAEAAWQNNDEGTARKVLDELNKERIYAYVNTKSSGDQLMEEIRISRRMELWGEGFSWFDFKRWNMPINRNKWENGKQDSGNWPASVAGPYKTSLSRGWRWRIPSTEYNYNHAIDQAEANEGSEDDLMP